MRLGMMGGTFNPIHYGHLAAANEVREAFSLDTIVFVPAAIPPHKELDELLDARHRFAMTILATVSHPQFVVSSIEVDRPGASYTVDTIAQVKQLYPTLQALYLIVGIDAFVDIASWRQPDVLLKSCHTVVTSRPGYDLRAMTQRTLEQVSVRYPGVGFEPLPRHGSFAEGAFGIWHSPSQVHLLEVSGLDISSTTIRQRVKTGRSIRYLLPDAVAAYIRKYQLYR